MIPSIRIIAVEIYQRDYEKIYSVDNLLLNPVKALIFCEKVRDAMKEYNWNDETILTELLNWRKKGKR